MLTRARFEVWPTLGAAVAIAIALAAYGLLRRHWRAAGLERPRPIARSPAARRVLRIGVGLFALFLLHQLLARRAGAAAAVSYIPVIGGCLELIMLYRFWDAALEARQTTRSLAREPLLWLGLALALFPPTLQPGAADRPRFGDADARYWTSGRGSRRPGTSIEWMFT